jgi:tRNA-splicing ligase RtcB (3'-phosphate/5'-hydroxy nucleic acid ligase)
MHIPITGRTLIEWGYQPGSWFAKAIAAAEDARAKGATEAEIKAIVNGVVPPRGLPIRAAGALEHRLNIRAETPEEQENLALVERHMIELMRVPTITAGAVMPDACPAGQAPGTIPVGGVAAAENAIHPGMHSSDICCSLAMSILKDADPKAVLDAGMRLSHFGGGGRKRGSQIRPPEQIMERFAANSFLAGLTSDAIEHFATQGDGNHFFYVGRLASTGDVSLVTHHGSRRPGAMLYKAGMATAQRFGRHLSPETPSHNAWIPADTREGEDYWSALQAIRQWTKANHFAIHDLVAEHLGVRVEDRFWNEHNFVFRKPDGLFYHAKGATPAWADFAEDSSGLTLIPLNMREPVLITRGCNADNGLGFAPHGAGRNFSRTVYLRKKIDMSEAELVKQETQGIDARFYSGFPDLSELPGAYKNAATVRRQIEEYGLAEVVDKIEPIGCIMAGDWIRPFRRGKKTAIAAARLRRQDDAP